MCFLGDIMSKSLYETTGPVGDGPCLWAVGSFHGSINEIKLGTFARGSPSFIINL